MRLHRPGDRQAFSLVELLVVIGLLSMLVTIIMPSLTRALSLARRVSCKKNVQEISRACFTYANDQRVHRLTRPGIFPTLGTGTLTKSTWWKMDATKTGNVHGLWMLIDGGFASRFVFICPASRASGYQTAPDTATYFQPDTCSYSYASMVGDIPGTVPPMPYSNKMTVTDMPSTYVYLADKNPFITVSGSSFTANASDPSRNSDNHGGEGQNVARLDQSVAWLRTNTVKNASGADDNIYLPTNPAKLNDGERGALDDAFLIP